MKTLGAQAHEPLFGGGKSTGLRTFSARSRITVSTLPSPEHDMKTFAASEQHASDDDAFDEASMHSDHDDTYDRYKQMLENDADQSGLRNYDDDVHDISFAPHG